MIREFIGDISFSAWSIGAFWVSLVILAGLETLIPQGSGTNRELRWPTNFTLGAINMGLTPLIPVSAVVAAQWAEGNGVGLLNTLKLADPWWWVVVPAATLLIRSLSGYLAHVALHKIPLLWRIHRVHHFDMAIDISTGLRSHPAEFVFAFAVAVSVSVAFGLDPATLIAYETIDLVFSLFTHANIRLPGWLDALLRPIFTTPRWHLVHHSSYQPQTDSNYGTVFSFWDRLFGTYGELGEHGADEFEMGLREVRDSRASSLLWQLKSPALQVGGLRSTPSIKSSDGSKITSQRSNVR
jgi:sterol desaturase/sphingolipid hydroxylase (fatty acid hydroxylase superfamily)